MKIATRSALVEIFLKFVLILLASVPILSTGAVAQTGKNAVYDSNQNCCQKSPAFIDASAFGTSGTDICSVLNNVLVNVILTTYPYGSVIDARGLPATGTSMTCPSTQASPWSGIANPPPSTILLPAGVINIPATWMLPSNTHLIGEGDSVTSALNTTIEAIAGDFPAGSTMIQFGSSSLCSSACTGISVEQLVLAGQGLSVNGIVNEYAQDNSYADHVSLYQIRGTGLLVEGSATNSGPYTNIVFDTSSTYVGTSSTVCAQILNVSGGTRGIHGLSCQTRVA